MPKYATGGIISRSGGPDDDSIPPLLQSLSGCNYYWPDDIAHEGLLKRINDRGVLMAYFPEGIQFADSDKVMEIADRMAIRWASLLDRLSDHDGPAPRLEES